MDDRVIQNINDHIASLEPQIESLEQVLLKYEMDLEQGRALIDQDDEMMRAMEEQIEQLHTELLEVDEERRFELNGLQIVDQKLTEEQRTGIELDIEIRALEPKTKKKEKPAKKDKRGGQQEYSEYDDIRGKRV